MLPVVGPKLLDRFASEKGYAAFSDAAPSLEAWRQIDIQTAVLSNADDRIRSFSFLVTAQVGSRMLNIGCIFFGFLVKVLKAVGLDTLLTAPPTLNHLCGYSKPDARIYQFAIDQASSTQEGAPFLPEEVLMIGDELEAYVFFCLVGSCEQTDLDWVYAGSDLVWFGL